MSTVFLDPHGDDSALFASFTIQREAALVIVVYDSYIQVNRGNLSCDRDTRRHETMGAMQCLLGNKADVRFAGLRDDVEHSLEEIAMAIHHVLPSHVEKTWVPAWEPKGHQHHNLVSLAAESLFQQDSIRHYMTYTTAGKSRGHEVPIPYGCWVRNKLKALACYRTQIDVERVGCRPHFLADLREFTQESL